MFHRWKNIASVISHSEKRIRCLVLCIGFPFFARAEAPVFPAWNLGTEEPQFYLHCNDIFRQKAQYALMPDGRKALKVDLTGSDRKTFYGLFRSYRDLPDFSDATLSDRISQRRALL
ncbi:MAG: hypothetical protein PHS41_07840 [Victivallaceae bacterium]|nr:hypothetical protein [Victivallaceae bacterium]